MKKTTSTQSELFEKPFKDRLRSFRDSQGMSRAALATGLGVTPITLYRSETGSTKPSPLAAEKLGEMGFGAVSHDETNMVSISRLKSTSNGSQIKAHALALREAGRTEIGTGTTKIKIL